MSVVQALPFKANQLYIPLMLEFLLGLTFQLPTVIFTVPLLVCILYWLMVIIGAADIDILGSADGTFEALDAADAALDSAGGALEASDAVVDAEGLPSNASILSVLRLRSAPVTVVVSLWTLLGWCLCGVGSTIVPTESLFVQAGIFGASLFVSLLATSFLLRPLAPLFAKPHESTARTFIGKTAVLRTLPGKRSSQAVVDDGDAGVMVRVDIKKGNTLSIGDEVLLIDFDESSNTYTAEGMKLLSSAKAHSSD